MRGAPITSKLPSLLQSNRAALSRRAFGRRKPAGSEGACSPSTFAFPIELKQTRQFRHGAPSLRTQAPLEGPEHAHATARHGTAGPPCKDSGSVALGQVASGLSSTNVRITEFFRVLRHFFLGYAHVRMLRRKGALVREGALVRDGSAGEGRGALVSAPCPGGASGRRAAPAGFWCLPDVVPRSLLLSMGGLWSGGDAGLQCALPL